MDNELTEEEEKAIRSLQRLAKKWPKSLLVFASGSNDLSIRKGGVFAQYEVDVVIGIPNEGGDGGDTY